MVSANISQAPPLCNSFRKKKDSSSSLFSPMALIFFLMRTVKGKIQFSLLFGDFELGRPGAVVSPKPAQFGCLCLWIDVLRRFQTFGLCPSPVFFSPGTPLFCY